MSVSESQGGASTTGASPERRDYLKWSCDRLSATLESENAARANLRTQSHAGFLLVPPVLAYSLTRIAVANTPWVLVVKAQCDFVVVLASICALVGWYQVMKVTKVPGLNVAVFVADEGTAAHEDYEHRYVRARHCLTIAVDAAQQGGNTIGIWRKWSLRATLIAVIAAAAPIIVERFTK